MGRSNSSGISTHTDQDGNLITLDHNGLPVLLGQDEQSEPDPFLTEQDDMPDPPQVEQSSEDPAAGGFLIPELQTSEHDTTE